MRLLIVGCGSVGRALGAELVRAGHQVVGLRRSADAAPALVESGIEPFVADLTRADAALPAGPFDAVVYLPAPKPDEPSAAHRALRLEATQRLLAHLALVSPAKWIHVSSTAVYGQRDGAIVKESSPTEPADAAARLHLESERLVTDAARGRFTAVILRVAEIYGPDQATRLDRFVHNQVRLTGPGQTYLNVIHRDDVVAALLAALRNGRAGETYNVVDDEPVTEIHFYTWLAETLGKWVPRSAPPGDPGALPLNSPHRRVSNRRLTMELGCRLKYPNFRLGYTAEIKRLTDAGLLEIAPEQR